MAAIVVSIDISQLVNERSRVLYNSGMSRGLYKPLQVAFRLSNQNTSYMSKCAPGSCKGSPIAGCGEGCSCRHVIIDLFITILFEPMFPLFWRDGLEDVREVWTKG